MARDKNRPVVRPPLPMSPRPRARLRARASDSPRVATIRDVARAARVSVATVSRALNGSALVRKDTVQLVRQAAQRLNYWPNAAARSLISSRTLALGVLLPDLHGEFFSEVIRGVDLAARRAGYHLLVSSSHAKTEDLVAALNMMHGRIDGLIVMAPELDNPELVRDCARGTPTLLVNPGQRFRDSHSIALANFDGAARVVRHLISLGHQHIAVVTGPAHNTDARERLEGYRASLEDANLKLDPRIELPGDFSEPSGYEAGGILAALDPRPTAVFVTNDKMAVGVLGALSDAGIKVPQGMAVVGFDDIEMAKYLNPPLTTVHADAYRLGERAVERALELLDKPESPPRHEILPTMLVIRSSCGGWQTDHGSARVHRDRMRLLTDPAEPCFPESQVGAVDALDPTIPRFKGRNQK